MCLKGTRVAWHDLGHNFPDGWPPLDTEDGKISTGSPTAIQLSGTTASGGNAVRMWTIPLIRTVARAPIRAPLNTVAPVARKALSSTSQPVR
jgi:hypothetical protein